MRILLLSALFLLSPLVNAGDSATGDKTHKESFDQTVSDYIQAIEERDIDALLATMTSGEELVLIFPDSTTLYKRQEYVDFHQKWFADMGWKMELETIYSMVEDSFGIALIKTTYTDEAGPRQALLSLTFALEDGQWRLVFDQNTRIAVK